MRTSVYSIDGRSYRFSPLVFDSMFGHGVESATKMRQLADSMHVSVSSIKDWRRGVHAPSDIGKVKDIAIWAKTELDALLIEIRDEPMEKCTERQFEALCELWNQAYDFLDLADAVDKFVWKFTDLNNVPPSLLHDVHLGDEATTGVDYGDINSSVLLVQTLEAYERSLRRAALYVEGLDVYRSLCEFADIINELGFGEDDGDWVPDPDMLFDPQPEGYVAPMIAAMRKGQKLLDETKEDLLEIRNRLI